MNQVQAHLSYVDGRRHEQHTTRRAHHVSIILFLQQNCLYSYALIMSDWHHPTPFDFHINSCTSNKPISIFRFLPQLYDIHLNAKHSNVNLSVQMDIMKVWEKSKFGNGVDWCLFARMATWWTIMILFQRERKDNTYSWCNWEEVLAVKH